MHIGASIMKLLLKIRYRVKITWLELIEKDSPNLILPSHVALMDPAIIYAYLRWKWTLCPVVVDDYYNKPILNIFFRWMKAVEVADIERHEEKDLDAQMIMKQLIARLEKNKNVLLYPQWEMARQWFQSIIGKKTAFYAVQQAPKWTKVLTVNINWLRGSRSSRAWTWHSPKLFWFLLKGFLFTIVDLIFFVPKRDVKIEIKDMTEELQKITKKWVDKFNQELEKIYNKKWEEKLEYISWLFWCNTVKKHKEPEIIEWSIKELQRTSFNWLINIPEDIQQKVISIIQKIKPEYKWKIDLNTNLILDCFFDSLNMSELKSTVQSTFSNTSNPPLLDLKTVWDVAMMAIWKSALNEDLKPCEWTNVKDKKMIYSYIRPIINKDSTILSVMKESFQARWMDDSFCYDESFWHQTVKDFLIKAYLISNILKRYPWERVAIMLPSLSATALLVVACYLAEKVPVMLNRTLSEEAFSHCLKSQDIKTILTAKSFLQKIQRPRLQNYEMNFIEDMLSSISIMQKLKAVNQSKKLKLPKHISNIAVVLFTSWSEALPKTVELTHQNLLQDLLWAAGIIELKTGEVQICYLPSFHSFGFALWIILPLISKWRIVFSSNPNDSANIAKLINHTKPVFLASTPTFLRWVVQSAKWNQIESLRIAIVWAERCPNDLFTKFTKKAPNATIVEWYGITECSPIIAVNPVKRNHKIKKWTVWLPINWEKVKILELETLKEVKEKQEWMIYVKWSNIFSGYVDKKLESPFVEIDGEMWYQTGDLWFIDKDGYLSVSGRLKRFVKIAWEMISLPAIESTLARKWKLASWEECLAIETQEKSDWSVYFVLFTTENIDLHEANSYLHEQWVSNLVHIDEIRQIDNIPMLWTWKVDHVQLQKIMKWVENKKK